MNLPESQATALPAIRESLQQFANGDSLPSYRVELDGDTLKLGSTSPIQSGGKTVDSYLTWRRAEPR